MVKENASRNISCAEVKNVGHPSPGVGIDFRCWGEGLSPRWLHSLRSSNTSRSGDRPEPRK